MPFLKTGGKRHIEAYMEKCFAGLGIKVREIAIIQRISFPGESGESRYLIKRTKKVSIELILKVVLTLLVRTL